LPQRGLDLVQIAFPHRFQGVRIRGIQVQLLMISLIASLQRHQPGVQIFAAQITIEAL
jgi:hypothetical protein